MVAAEVLQSIDHADLPEEKLRWCSVTLNEVLQRGSRLEASVFDIEGKHAKEVLKRCQWPLVHVSGDDGIAEVYHRPRFKRIWIDRIGIPIFQPSQVQEIHPTPSGYLSNRTNTDINALIVRKGQILLTCSGTIGMCSLDQPMYCLGLVLLYSLNLSIISCINFLLVTRIRVLSCRFSIISITI